jgi:hypothetical protein
MTTTDEAPIVVRDVFPARVVVGDRVLTSARVIVTRDRLLAYIKRGEPALDEPYDPAQSTVPGPTAPSSTPTHLALLDGRTATISRQRGCGCGSPVRSWRPWSPWRVAS